MVKRTPTKTAPKKRTKAAPKAAPKRTSKPMFDYAQCDFVLAIVKGIVEHNDGCAYFGSLGGYRHWEEQGTKRGLLTRGLKECADGGGGVFTIEATRLTDAGRAAYDTFRLDLLPQKYGSRAYMWDWSSSSREL